MLNPGWLDSSSRNSRRFLAEGYAEVAEVMAGMLPLLPGAEPWLAGRQQQQQTQQQLAFGVALCFSQVALAALTACLCS